MILLVPMLKPLKNYAPDNLPESPGMFRLIFPLFLIHPA
jgi:hypothetical protein